MSQSTGEPRAKSDKQSKRAKPPRRPTIRDVSKLAGVSRMTVSRVISEPDLVLPPTREKVLRAIADLGYVPDRAAGSLSSRRTGFIALMLPTLTNANFSLVAHGLTEVLRAANYQLLIAYDNYDLSEEERQLANLLARRPEAIVLTGAVHSRTAAKMLIAAGTPIVEIADLPVRPIEHAVGFSNYEVGRTAAQYLIGKGFTHIGAVASKSQDNIGDYRGEDRVRGFEDELQRCGLSTDLVLRHGKAPVSYDHGARAIALMLERNPEVEAVFAVSDMSAVGVMMECQRRGVSVPDRLSVLGFGDFEIGREINPPLTTIHVDFHALGREAGELILKLVSGERDEDAPALIDVELSLIERGTVRGK